MDVAKRTTAGTGKWPSLERHRRMVIPPHLPAHPRLSPPCPLRGQPINGEVRNDQCSQ